jgi:Reverse transcriptase (RNA-dependent DNA polymerase)
MYGKVDVPRMFKKTLRNHLLSMGMSQSVVDPCLYYKRSAQGRIELLACTHVDDILLVGPKSEIEWFKTGVKKRFNISDLGKLKKHLGVWYDWRTSDDGETYIVASMKKLEEEIVKKFESVTERTARLVNTPGYPGKYLTKNEGDPVDIENYRSIVGKIMYYATKIAPDVCNAARELAQHLSSPGEEHWKAMERVVGYIKAEHYEGLVYRKPKALRPISIVDSDYAKDMDDRKSISSGLHLLGGTLVNWESKKQDCVTLSSTEAEYHSLAKGACENKFIMMLLDEAIRHKEEDRLIGWVFEDNMGAIYLVKNQHVGARTKHIDVKTHFIRELVETGWFTVMYVKTNDNAADILNKHAVEKIHRKHADAIRGGTLNCWREDVKMDRDVTSPEFQHSTTSVTSSARRVQQPPRSQIFTTSSGAEKKVRFKQELGSKITLPKSSPATESGGTKCSPATEKDNNNAQWSTVQYKRRKGKRTALPKY